jgi:serine protease AprX
LVIVSARKSLLLIALAAPNLLAAQSAPVPQHRPNPPSHDLAEAEARARNSPALLRLKSGPLAKDPAVMQITGEPVDMGSPKQFSVAVLEDSVPLPVPPQYATGPAGDRLVAPASGDPFFLGFSPGKYYPPPQEKIDPLLLSRVRAQYDDGRSSGETYAFVMFQKRMTEARLAELRALGVRTLEFHPFYTMKVALAPTLIDQVAALDYVRWIGLPRDPQRVHTDLLALIGTQPSVEPLDVYIDVYDSDLNPSSRETVIAKPVLISPDRVQVVDDNGRPATKWMSNGWQQRALESIGVDVTEYIDTIRAFRAKLLPAQLELLLALDFVQFVEADLPMELATSAVPHDESTAMVYSDLNRYYYDGGTSLSAVGGQADSGLDNGHSDLGIWGVGWDFTATTGAFADGCEHGSHVAGSILGRGNTNPSFRGQAPGLGWGGAGRFFVARIFDNTCGYSGSSLSSIMGVLHTDYNDGVNITPKPHVINHSWGSTAGGGFFGTEADPRLIDDEVHGQAQLHIWASGNHGTTGGTIGLQPSAKNCFTVGSVVDYPGTTYGDPGSLYNNATDGSSNGPVADGRWKPNAVAPGRWITSVDANTSGGYDDKYGTSMATPHVTGLGAELVDHLTGFQGWPEPLSALMMTTAMTKDNATYSTPSDSHLDNYGAGRIEGYRAHWTTSQIATYYWYFGIGNSSTNVEFPVNSGATRLVFTMHYSEGAASAGASQALVNNFNSYLDYPPVDTANDNTGDFVIQQSSLDNTEIRIIDNPSGYATGNWRLKVWPQSVPGFAYMGLCVQIIYGDTTPDGSLLLSADDYYVQPNTDVAINATVTNPSFVASAVVLDSSSSGDSLQSSSTTLGDGAVTNLLHNQSSGRDVTLGDIIHGSSRTAHWVTRWASEGVKSWCVDARSDNWIDENQCINVTVDGTPPALVGNLHSTSHTVNVWSNDPTIDFAWNVATDNLSGIQGYGVSWGNSPGVFVGNAVDTVAASYTTPAFGSNAAWYFAVKTADNCDNWTAGTSEVGPYKIDTVVPVAPGVLTSSTHTAGVQSCSTTVTVSWTAASDALSGLVGYLGVWNTTAVFDPTGATNLGSGSTSSSTNIGSSTLARYYHLRAKDNAGNYSITRHFGPVYANASSVTPYCTGKTNSLGCVPAIGTNGVQPDKSAGTFTVNCTSVINQKNGLLFWGRGQIAVPFQGGTLCVMAPTVRTLNISSGGAGSGSSCSGTYTFNFSTAYMNANAINPGDTIYCQWWMRDPPSPSTTGLSNALRFTVCQ